MGDIPLVPAALCLGISLWPEGATWQEVRSTSVRVDELGYDSLPDVHEVDPRGRGVKARKSGATARTADRLRLIGEPVRRIWFALCELRPRPDPITPPVPLRPPLL